MKPFIVNHFLVFSGSSNLEFEVDRFSTMTSNATQSIWNEYFHLNSEYLKKESLLYISIEEEKALIQQNAKLMEKKKNLQLNIKEQATLLQQLTGMDDTLSNSDNHSSDQVSGGILHHQLEQLKRYVKTLDDIHSNKNGLINKIDELVQNSMNKIEEKLKIKKNDSEIMQDIVANSEEIDKNSNDTQKISTSNLSEKDELLKFLETKGVEISDMNLEQLESCVNEMENVVELLNSCVEKSLCGNCFQT